MIVFRFHRGTLAESIETAKEFEDVVDMEKYIKEWAETQPMPFKIKRYPYYLKEEYYCYDDRLNTNDFIVTMLNRVSGQYEAVGMYSANTTLKDVMNNFKNWDRRVK